MEFPGKHHPINRRDAAARENRERHRRRQRRRRRRRGRERERPSSMRTSSRTTTPGSTKSRRSTRPSPGREPRATGRPTTSCWAGQAGCCGGRTRRRLRRGRTGDGTTGGGRPARKGDGRGRKGGEREKRTKKRAFPPNTLSTCNKTPPPPKHTQAHTGARANKHCQPT